MKITNLYNLPLPIQQAVKFNDQLRGDLDRRHDLISVTKLVNPVQIHYLTRRYDQDLSEDVIDRFWALFGQAVHAILSWNTPSQDTLTEKRLTIPIAKTGMLLTGQFDRLHLPSQTLGDWKTTSVWSIAEGVKWEWEAQLNCLRYLCQAHGYAVNKLEIVAILRDWSSAQQLRDPDYPPLPVVTLPVNVWDEEETHDYIVNRMSLHQSALADGIIPPCSDRERWMRPTMYAVKKPDGKRALRLFANREEAQQFMGKTPGTLLEIRAGACIRCERFCSVAAYCPQFQADQQRLAA
jgi:hypothetical protein